MARKQAVKDQGLSAGNGAGAAVVEARGLVNVRVEVAGVTPLLMHRWTENAEATGGSRDTLVIRNPRAEAEGFAYRTPNGDLYLPSIAFLRAMAGAGANHRHPGQRKTLRFVVPSAIRATTEVAFLVDEAGAPLRDIEVDARPVTIPATKGRIMRYRARLDRWRARLELAIYTRLMEPRMAHRLLVDAGQMIGVGDYRPEKSGPFGTFQIHSWEEVV